MKQRAKNTVLATLSILIALGLRLNGQNPPAMEFVKIPAGEFTMGCSTGDTECNPDETPRHSVRITKSFEIGRYEVTQAQWVAVMQSNPSNSKGDSRPVEMVNKIEIQDFIAKLNARNDGYRYRLPTEAEWEYAARAGADSPNTGPIDEVAWYAENSDDETHPVGRKKPNAWGLYDMQGNVREFVSDFYSSDYYGISPVADPTGAQLVIDGRGGPVGRGLPPRGGRGGPPGAGPARGLREGATPQEQIDDLRRQVDELRFELEQLRNAFEAGPPPRGGRGGRGPGGPGGPPIADGRGPRQGPAIIGPDGQFIDPLDGLPTGLPVIRGGGWDQSAPYQRVSARYSYYGPQLKFGDLGFRLVREPATP